MKAPWHRTLFNLTQRCYANRFIPLFAILLLLCAIEGYQLIQLTPLHRDELRWLETAFSPEFIQIWQTCFEILHPPGGFIFYRLLYPLNASLNTLRIVSLLFVLGSALCLFLLIQRYRPRIWALVGSALFLTSSLIIVPLTEIRAYGIFLFFLSFGLYLFESRSPQRHGLGLIFLLLSPCLHFSGYFWVIFFISPTILFFFRSSNTFIKALLFTALTLLCINSFGFITSNNFIHSLKGGNQYGYVASAYTLLKTKGALSHLFYSTQSFLSQVSQLQYLALPLFFVGYYRLLNSPLFLKAETRHLHLVLLPLVLLFSLFELYPFSATRHNLFLLIPFCLVCVEGIYWLSTRPQISYPLKICGLLATLGVFFYNTLHSHAELRKQFSQVANYRTRLLDSLNYHLPPNSHLLTFDRRLISYALSTKRNLPLKDIYPSFKPLYTFKWRHSLLTFCPRIINKRLNLSQICLDLLHYTPTQDPPRPIYLFYSKSLPPDALTNFLTQPLLPYIDISDTFRFYTAPLKAQHLNALAYTP